MEKRTAESEPPRSFSAFEFYQYPRLKRQSQKAFSKKGWKKFGIDTDAPDFYSQVLPILKKVIDEGSKYKEEIVPKGTVSYYIKNFADKGYEIIVKIFTHPNGEKVLSDAYINTR